MGNEDAGGACSEVDATVLSGPGLRATLNGVTVHVGELGVHDEPTTVKIDVGPSQSEGFAAAPRDTDPEISPAVNSTP